MAALLFLTTAQAQETKVAQDSKAKAVQEVKTEQKAKTEQPSDTARFMNQYRAFAKYVETHTITRKNADSLSACQDSLMTTYRKIKPQLTDSQVEEYNTLKGRYYKYVLDYRGDRFNTSLEAAGDSIAKTTGRVGKAVGGFFKGLFEK
jgi:hypothetical protein